MKNVYHVYLDETKQVGEYTVKKTRKWITIAENAIEAKEHISKKYKVEVKELRAERTHYTT